MSVYELLVAIPLLWYCVVFFPSHHFFSAQRTSFLVNLTRIQEYMHDSTEFQRRHCLSNFDLAEYRPVFSDIAVSLFQRLVYLIVQRIKSMIGKAFNGVLRHNAQHRSVLHHIKNIFEQAVRKTVEIRSQTFVDGSAGVEMTRVFSGVSHSSRSAQQSHFLTNCWSISQCPREVCSIIASQRF